MKLIAHKGVISSKDIPNSMSAFQNALSKSYVSGIECDVRLTKDSKVVIMHDPVIDFVSEGNGIVKLMTLEEIKQYHLDNKEAILSLKELLQNIHSDKLILIELKGENNDFKLVEEVNKIILEYKKLNIVVISFWYTLLKRLKKINPSVKTGLLIGYFLNQNKIYNHFDYNLFSYHYLDQIYMNKKIMFFTINKRKEIEIIKQKRQDVYVITDFSSSFQNFV